MKIICLVFLQQQTQMLKNKLENMTSRRKSKKGLMNDYRANIPWSELVFKDIFFSLKELINYFKNGLKNRTILAYPEFPSRNSTFYKICTELNYNITNHINRNYCLAIFWEDATVREQNPDIETISKTTRVINYSSMDIRKNLVDQIHHEVFGYSTRLNPRNYEGKCVRKNDINASHDGQILNCPISEPDQRYIYQKLIDNTYDDEHVVDIRVPIIGKTIPLVYFKYKPIDARFGNFRMVKNVKSPEIHEPEAIFSKSEIHNIMEMAEKMNIEFGEMDILRDNHDKRIYVIDVNNTPTGPSNFSKSEYKKAIKKLSSTFIRQFQKER